MTLEYTKRKKRFVKQAKLPRGAYAKTLPEVLEPFMKRAHEEKIEQKRKVVNKA